jgi:hypothetical protein
MPSKNNKHSSLLQTLKKYIFYNIRPWKWMCVLDLFQIQRQTVEPSGEFISLTLDWTGNAQQEQQTL